MSHSAVGRVHLSTLEWLILLALSGVLAWSLGPLVFASFPSVDDEGYLLVSLRAFAAGKPLYSEVWSQYGPVYTLIFGTLGRLGLAITHDSMRVATLIGWLLTVPLLAAAAWRMTGSRLTGSRLTGSRAALVYALLFGALPLRVVLVEPTHPQFLVELFAVALLVIAARPGTGGRRLLSMLALGSLVALTTLTKVNSGLFLLLATFLAVTAGRPRRSLAGVVFLLTACAAVLLTPLLTRRLLDDPAILRFTVVITVVTLAVVALMAGAEPSRTDTEAPNDDLLAVCAGGTLTTLIVLAALLGDGTNLRELIDFQVIRPLRFSGRFFIPWPDPLDGAVITAGLALLGAGAWLALRRGAWLERRGPRWSLPSLRIGLALAMPLVANPRNLLAWIAAAVLLLMPTPAPVSTEADAPAEAPDLTGRRLLAVLSALFPLLAFPVAGAQRVLGLVFTIAVLAVLLSDGMNELAGLIGASSTARRSFDRAVAALIVLGFFAIVPITHMPGLSRATVPLDLPGARLVRLPPKHAAIYRAVSRELEQGDSFISLPGLNSFYLWSEQEPPTSLNLTWWPALLNAEEQQFILDELRGRPRLRLLRNRALEQFWSARVEPEPSPLLDFLDREFVLDRRIGRFEIFRRR